MREGDERTDKGARTYDREHTGTPDRERLGI